MAGRWSNKDAKKEASRTFKFGPVGDADCSKPFLFPFVGFIEICACAALPPGEKTC